MSVPDQKDVVLDQGTPDAEKIPPLTQVDSEGGLHEPDQGSKLEDSTAHSKDHPKDQPLVASWLQVARKKTNSVASCSATSSKVALSTDQSKAGMPVKAVQKEPTANDMQKIISRLAELEKVVATNGKGKLT